MKTPYVVTKIEGTRIFASPLEMIEKNTQANIEVINPKKITVSEGTKVFIGLPKTAEMINGFISLLIPIALCFLAFAVSPFIAECFSLKLTEGFKAVCVITAFTVSVLAILVYTRNIPTIVKLQILSLADRS